MKGFIRILRTTIVGGIFFLIPFVVIIIVFSKAVRILRVITAPVAEHIPIKSALGMETPRILAIVLLIVFCFLAGLIARTRLARKLVGWLEANLLSNIPGYSFIKKIGEEAAGAIPAGSHEVVLVCFDDAWQIGFLMERISDGQVVVFIPDSPTPWAGGVFILSEDRIKPLNVPSTAAIKSLQRYGEGTGAIVE